MGLTITSYVSEAAATGWAHDRHERPPIATASLSIQEITTNGGGRDNVCGAIVFAI